MPDTRRDFAPYLAEYRVRSGPVIAEFETVIKQALRNDPEFDASSPEIVRGVEMKTKGGIRLVPGDAIPAGRAKPTIDGAWMPDRRVLAELLVRTLENRSRRWLAAENRYLPMREAWPDVLRRRWPDHFCCELSIGPGWVDLLIATHTWLIQLGGDFRWSQIKEKFAGLRLYHDGDVGDVGNEIINVAESVISQCICDECGAPGRKRNSHGWLATRCDGHA